MKLDTYERACQLQQVIKDLGNHQRNIKKMEVRMNDPEFSELRELAYNLATQLILKAEREFQLL